MKYEQIVFGLVGLRLEAKHGLKDRSNKHSLKQKIEQSLVRIRRAPSLSGKRIRFVPFSDSMLKRTPRKA